jgi:integrase
MTSTKKESNRTNRPAGEGSVYQTKNGSGVPVWMGSVLLSTGRKRVTGKNRTEVARKLRELRDADKRRVEDGEIQRTRTVPVGEILELWLTEGVHERRRNGRPLSSGTLANHQWAVDRLMEASCRSSARFGAVVLFRDVDANTLTRSQVRDALQDISANPKPKSNRIGAKAPRALLTAEALKRIRNVLAMALAYGSLRELIVDTPAANAPIPVNVAEGGQRFALSKDQARRLAAGLRHDPDGALFYVMLRTGLRFGEVTALTPSEIVGGALNIWRSVRRVYEPNTSGVGPKRLVSYALVEELKNTASRRTIAVPSDVLDVLSEHMERNAERLEADRLAGRPPLLFRSPTGGWLDSKFAGTQLAAKCRELDVMIVDSSGDEPVKRPPILYELRHTCATLLLDTGARPVDVSNYLGHRDTVMLMRVYRHLDEHAPRTAALFADWNAA